MTPWLLAVAALLACAVVAGVPSAAPPPNPTPLAPPTPLPPKPAWLPAKDGVVDVLFIGNSQLQANEALAVLDGLAKAARAKDRTLPTLRIWPGLRGGAGLRGYYDEGTKPGTPRGELLARPYDVVVLQEWFGAKRDELARDLKPWLELIAKQPSKPAVLLFASASISEWYPQGFELIDDATSATAHDTGVGVIAAGLAVRTVLGETPSSALLLSYYQDDKAHPGPRATYLYAAAMWSTLMGRSAVGLAPHVEAMGTLTLTADEALAAQRAVDAASHQLRARAVAPPPPLAVAPPSPQPH